MTIDEQIISLRKHDLLCHDSDLQIAEWLEELKVLREKAKGDKWYHQGRADAIKEFYLKFDDELKRMLNSEFAFSRDKNVLLGVGRMLDMVVEQLKEQNE